MSNFLFPHGLQHSRLPCPSLSPGVCSNSCPLSQWCLPTISSSVALNPFALNLSHHQSFPMNWLFASGGQSIKASAPQTAFSKWLQHYGSSTFLLPCDLVTLPRKQWDLVPSPWVDWVFVFGDQQNRMNGIHTVTSEGRSENHVTLLDLLYLTFWLCSKMNYIRYSVINHNRKEYEKECIYTFIYMYVCITELL